MNLNEFAQVFPLGSHLCREPMPLMSEMKKDMENLKRHGFNMIKMQDQWQVAEPLEGRYDSSRYEELIEHAARLDMGVFMTFVCEEAPNWLWRKHPGCRMVGRNGVPIAYEAQSDYPADGKPGPCFDHPGARADMLRYIKRQVQTLGRYENVVVWDTWQEIGYWSEALVGQPVCYCTNTIECWRQWLQEKYGDLDGLNRAWNSRYLDWSYVQPDRCIRCSASSITLPQEVDWRYFMDNVQVARILSARNEAIKDADPLKRPVLAHKGAPMVGAGQDWVYARCLDFLGSSCYPAWGSGHHWDDRHPALGLPADRHTALLAEMWDNVALRFDYLRSCNERGRPIWAAEFQAGPACSSIHKGRVPSPDDVRRWMLTAMGSGVTAISLWIIRSEIAAYEMHGFSMLDSEGDTTPRFEEAARVGQALQRHADLFARPTTPVAEVGILINEWNFVFCQTMTEGRDHLSYSVRGWYRLLWDLGIPVDFVNLDMDAESIACYKVLILPFPLSLSEEAAGKLAHYVENGGRLICEVCPGRADEHTYCNRGELSPTMRRLFGVSHESITMVREPASGRRWSPQEWTWGEYLDATQLVGAGPLAGLQARANLYIETFICRGSEPCLRYGEAVAGTVRKVGKGWAWLLGTIIGHSGTAYRDMDTSALVRSLFKACDVTSERAENLLLRRRVGQGKEAWFFTNPTERTVTERINVAGWGHVEDLLSEPLMREGDQITLTVKSLDVQVLVLQKDE